MPTRASARERLRDDECAAAAAVRRARAVGLDLVPGERARALDEAAGELHAGAPGLLRRLLPPRRGGNRLLRPLPARRSAARGRAAPPALALALAGVLRRGGLEAARGRERRIRRDRPDLGASPVTPAARGDLACPA